MQEISTSRYSKRNSVKMQTIKGILKKRGLEELDQFDQHPQKEIIEEEVQEPSIFSKGSSRILKGVDTERLDENKKMMETQKYPDPPAGSNLNRVWRAQPLNIIYYISKFTRQLKTSANKIKFKLLTFRILSLINDNGSDSLTLLQMRDNQFQQKDRQNNIQKRFRQLIVQIPVIEPDSVYKLIWDILMLLAIVINIFYIPMELSFNFQSDSEVTFYLNTLPSWLFVVDILVTFQTAYYYKGMIHRNQFEIFKNYAKGKLLIDIVVVVPLLLSMLDLPILKFSLLFRVFRVPQMIENIEEVINPKQYTATILQLFKLIYFIIIMCHFCACIWAFLGEYQIDSNDYSWMVHYEIDQAEWTTKYIYSFYYSAITTLTIGYGDITPQTDIERVYAVLLALLVCGVLGYSVSTVGTIITQIQGSRDQYKQKMSKLTRYLKSRNLNQQLQLQVRKYFEHYLKIQQESQAEAEEMMNDLTLELKENVAIDLYSSVLKKSRLFENICDRCIGKLCLFVKEKKYSPEQFVWNSEDHADKLIFILKGSMEIMGDQIPLKQAKKGAIGEREFAVQGIYKTKLKATKFSQVAYLNYSDFINVIRQHPEDNERFNMLRDNLLYNDNFKNFGQVCEICGWTHQMDHCPFVFIKINKNKIVSRYKDSREQQRTEFQRSVFVHKTKMRLDEIQECALALMLQKHMISESDLSDQVLKQLGFDVDEYDLASDESQQSIRRRSEDFSSDSQTPEIRPIQFTPIAEDSNESNTKKVSIPQERSNENIGKRIMKRQPSMTVNNVIGRRLLLEKQKSSNQEIKEVKIQTNSNPRDANSWRRLDSISLKNPFGSPNTQKKQQESEISLQRLPSLIKKNKNPDMLTQIQLQDNQSSFQEQDEVIDFDIDKQMHLRVYFPNYNFEEVIKKVQQQQKPSLRRRQSRIVQQFMF